MFDETYRQLDQLLQAEATRVSRERQRAEADSQRLNGELLPPDEPLIERDGGRDRRGVTYPSEPFVPLPIRTTHGGRWGPAMRSKLRAEALRR